MFAHKIKALAFASLMAVPAVMTTACHDKAKEDGSKTNTTYTFYCSGGQLAEGHQNCLTLNTSKKSVSASDFYMDYEIATYRVQGSGTYSGTIAKGKELTVTGLYTYIGGSKVNASGTITINKLDLVRDGKANGEVSYKFST